MRLLALPAVVLLTPATVPSDDASLHLSSGDDHTVLGALAELPASTDTDSVMVQTGDLVRRRSCRGSSDRASRTSMLFRRGSVR